MQPGARKDERLRSRRPADLGDRPIVQDPPAPAPTRAGALHGALEVGVPSAPDLGAEDLSDLAQAIYDHRAVRIEHARDGEERTRREVEPRRLVHRCARVYLLAWDRSRENWRTFRVDRLRGIAPAGARFEPRTVTEGRAASTRVRACAAGGNGWSSVSATAAQIADALPYEELELTPRQSGTTLVDAHVRGVTWVPHLLAMMPGAARVIGPEGRDSVLAQTRAVHAAHEEGNALRGDEQERHDSPGSGRVDDAQEPG